jgi:hypothetical protein
MKVLALTHAHLKTGGLSPVSCERADSVVSAWSDRLDWDIDVVHTQGTKWPGIWPEGKGLKINILREQTPAGLMMNPSPLFAGALKTAIKQRKFATAASMIVNRLTKRARRSLSAKGFVLPYEMAIAKKWGRILTAKKEINSKKYNFIFVSVGYGDEYLLQTALTISQTLNVPMIVDFRDLWSEHHEPERFTDKQRQEIRKYERKLLATTILISVPQNDMVTMLKKWVSAPVYLLQHSAYVGKDWEDGHVIKDVFTMLYAGKLYAAGPGIKMLLELIQNLARVPLSKPFKCHFFVDDTEALKKFAIAYGITDHVVVNEWAVPSQLWKNLRSAHLLVITDLGVAKDFSHLPTKLFQFAYTGKQILCLLQHETIEMQQFLDHFNAGIACTNTNAAVTWVEQIVKEKNQYESLPPRRNIALREDVAEAFGVQILKLFDNKRN